MVLSTIARISVSIFIPASNDPPPPLSSPDAIIPAWVNASEILSWMHLCVTEFTAAFAFVRGSTNRMGINAVRKSSLLFISILPTASRFVGHADLRHIAIPICATAAVKFTLIVGPLVAVLSIVPRKILFMHLNFALDNCTNWLPFG